MIYMTLLTCVSTYVWSQLYVIDQMLLCVVLSSRTLHLVLLSLVCIIFLLCFIFDVFLLCFFFFFSSRRRHTRFDCDWSSDVCSSDLSRQAVVGSQGRQWGDHMSRIPLKCTIVLLVASAALASCGGRGVSSGGGGSTGTAPVVLTMTDTPPTNVSLLSAKVTLTGATLGPGKVSLFSGATTIELTRLQTDIASISTTLVPSGSYTSLALTFSNPTLTIENDTGSSLVTGG